MVSADLTNVPLAATVLCRWRKRRGTTVNPLVGHTLFPPLDRRQARQRLRLCNGAHNAAISQRQLDELHTRVIPPGTMARMPRTHMPTLQRERTQSTVKTGRAFLQQLTSPANLGRTQPTLSGDRNISPIAMLCRAR